MNGLRLCDGFHDDGSGCSAAGSYGWVRAAFDHGSEVFWYCERCWWYVMAVPADRVLAAGTRWQLLDFDLPA